MKAAFPVLKTELLDIKDGSLRDRLEAIIDKDGIEEGLMQFVALKAAGFPELHVDEGQLNSLGYRYLKKSKLGEAIALLRLNAELYPNSSNVHDSLGEALAAAGEKEAAIMEYRKALELDPKAENAREKLKQLEAITSQ